MGAHRSRCNARARAGLSPYGGNCVVGKSLSIEASKSPRLKQKRTVGHLLLARSNNCISSGGMATPPRCRVWLIIRGWHPPSLSLSPTIIPGKQNFYIGALQAKGILNFLPLISRPCSKTLFEILYLLKMIQLKQFVIISFFTSWKKKFLFEAFLIPIHRLLSLIRFLANWRRIEKRKEKEKKSSLKGFLISSP